jgi:hypothetical protein
LDVGAKPSQNRKAEKRSVFRRSFSPAAQPPLIVFVGPRIVRRVAP